MNSISTLLIAVFSIVSAFHVLFQPMEIIQFKIRINIILQWGKKPDFIERLTTLV